MNLAFFYFMKKSTNSFPKLQIMLFLILFFSGCVSKSEERVLIKEQKFIEIYSKLLIISEMDITKEYHDRLISELMQTNGISLEDINYTIAYYDQQPERWITILQKVRDRIKELKSSQLQKSDRKRMK